MNASTETGSTTESVDYKALYESTEARRKEAHSSLTPVQQENARLKAELATLKSTPAQLPAEEQQRLDDLKYSDPDAWRNEINVAEASLKEQNEQAIKAKEKEIVAELSQAEVTNRTKDFFAKQPELDPKTVIDSMPKVLLDQLDKGEASLEEVLQKGVELFNGATIKSVLAPKSPKLSDVAGSKAPTDGAKKQQATQEWGATLV